MIYFPTVIYLDLRFLCTHLTTVVENSVRVSGGEGDAVILEVSFDRRFETHESAESAATKRRKELERLKQHIETLQSELQRVQVSARCNSFVMTMVR